MILLSRTLFLYIASGILFLYGISNNMANAQFYRAISYAMFNIQTLSYNHCDSSLIVGYQTTRDMNRFDITFDNFLTTDEIIETYNKYGIGACEVLYHRNTKIEFALYQQMIKVIVSYHYPFVTHLEPVVEFESFSLNKFSSRSNPISSGYHMILNDFCKDDSFVYLGPKLFKYHRNGGYVEFNDGIQDTFEFVTSISRIGKDSFYFAAVRFDASVELFDTGRLYGLYTGSFSGKSYEFLGYLPQKYSKELRNNKIFVNQNGELFVPTLSSDRTQIEKIDADLKSYQVVLDTRWDYNGARISEIINDPFEPNTFFMTMAGESRLFKTTDGFKSVYPVDFQPSISSTQLRFLQIFRPDLMGLVVGDEIYLSTNRGGSPYTSVNEQELLPRWSLHPNPVQDELSISSGVGEECHYTLYDLQGREIREMAGVFVRITTLSVAHLPAGLYLLRLSSDKGSATMKVVKR